ncbi:MAG: hypothetical protein AB8H03_28340 [Saprospiraceae bacterium]
MQLTVRLTKQPAILFPFLFILLSFQVHAKNDKFPGYIITLDDERIDGEIITGSITDNEVKIQFIEEGEDKKKTYKAKQLKGYGYESVQDDDLGLEYKRWIHYEQQNVDYPPKPFASTTVFMQREEGGALTLFCYYVEVRNDRKNPYRYHYYAKDAAGKLVKIEKKEFRKIAGKLFKNYTAMTSKIGKKDFEYKNLDRMVRDYNFWVDNQHNANEYRVALKQ